MKGTIVLLACLLWLAWGLILMGTWSLLLWLGSGIALALALRLWAGQPRPQSRLARNRPEKPLRTLRNGNRAPWKR